MKALIVGCGRLGAELAYRLYQSGHDVSIIDVDETAFTKLPADFQGRFSEGDALNRDVLRRAGIETADSLAIVTDNDVLNAVIGYLATSFYHVPNVVVRNYTPRNRQIQEAYGLQIVSALSWGAQRIEEMMYHSDVRAVFSAGNGEVEIYEIAIPDGCAGKMLGEIMNEGDCLPVAVTRAGKAMLPNLKMVLEVGDVVHVSATLEGVESLRSQIRCGQREV
jgi:trk system potassium uptake protein TrkA